MSLENSIIETYSNEPAAQPTVSEPQPSAKETRFRMSRAARTRQEFLWNTFKRTSMWFLIISMGMYTGMLISNAWETLETQTCPEIQNQTCPANYPPPPEPVGVFTSDGTLNDTVNYYLVRPVSYVTLKLVNANCKQRIEFIQGLWLRNFETECLNNICTELIVF